MNNEAPTRVLIVDDQNLFLDSLELYLKQDAGIRVIGTATNGRHALAMIKAEAPDVLLLDLEMPLMSGLEVAKIVKTDFPQVRIVILTTFEVEKDILETFAAGCEGYILKDVKPSDLILTIRSVDRGLIVMHPAAQAVVRERIRRGIENDGPSEADRSFESLTVLELQITKLVATGMSNKEIAAELKYTEGTIKNYVSRILLKTGCKDRTHIAIQSLKRNST